ncbi:hypothetical protein MIC97_20755 [Aquamicrobium sp. NLF2-7]|uniref:hypothetical protein n=1 Tax=Aquamicrobium sp. NLF2-7 TaxID=2918753 RepID=UPI001EFB3168|nr:hypothetical protein [Aquamicrobium sp. NLF2-7]MCG8273917.1 hypothetical protein [Aquamicrobium sp. NLF2-7]
MLKKAAWWIGGVVAAAIIGLYVVNWWQTNIMTPPPRPITLDFIDVQGCTMGKLVEIRDRQMGKDIPLTNGADTLTICDDQSLQAVRSELPRALANRIPGCLVWRGKDSGGLALVRKSDAVCGLPDGKGYICDGENARHPLGNSAIGDSMEPVAPCPPEMFRRFGFQS